MKFYIGDEHAATSHLTAAEFGSYVRLKMHYWQFGSLPDEDTRLARITRLLPDEWEAMKAQIQELFDNGWRSERMDELRAEAEESHQRRVEAGRKGGRPRKSEKQSYKQSFSDEKAKPKQPESEPEPYSDSAADSELEDLAYEKGREETITRVNKPFDVPRSISEGRRFLIQNRVPPQEIERCLKILMDGHLYPIDIQEWSIAARGAA